ncbi:MAG: NAD(+)/NADH kinase [Candidatus Korarchaeota archaeon]|nr:NAD(+)/NADH kinase [Candidatus Korarchaeota archaeon]
MPVKGSPVSKVTLIYNDGKKKTLKLARRLEDLLKSSGIKIVDRSESPDLAIVVGGDGTLLRAFHQTLGSIPLLGVKDGTYGTILEVDPEDIKHLPDALSKGMYWLEFASTVETRGKTKLVALNEFLIRSGKLGKSSRLGVAIDGIPIGECICDGIIISTPIGSMAYSLAAGGPLLDPRSEDMAVTYVAPWPPSLTLAVKSLVIPLNSEVEIWSPDAYVYVVADGLSPFKMHPPIKVSGSKVKAVLARLSPNPADFYRRIVRRMVPRRLTGIMDYLETGISPQNL